jgi:fructuronate reductase
MNHCQVFLQKSGYFTENCRGRIPEKEYVFWRNHKSLRKRTDLKATALTYIPIVITGGCRYLMGIDDRGEEMIISPDPLLEELIPYVYGVSFGNKGLFHKQLQPILSNPDIFGIDLYKVGLGKKIKNYFEELVSGIEAVRDALSRYL